MASFSQNQKSFVLVEVPAFVVEELTGPRRRVNLTGRALPYRPLKLSGSQRVELTWYPGYEFATATVLGPEEGSASVNGFWKDKYLGSSQAGFDRVAGLQGGGQIYPIEVFSPGDAAPSASTAQDAVELFDDIRRQGQVVRVSWGPITREGFLRVFEHTWHNLHDVEWSMEFLWTSQGEPVPMVVGTVQTGISQTIQTVLQKAARLEGESIPPLQLFQAAMDTYSDRMGRMNEAVSSVVATGEAAVRAVMQPADITRAAVSGLLGTVTRAEQLLDFLSEKPADFLVNRVAGGNIVQQVAGFVGGQDAYWNSFSTRHFPTYGRVYADPSAPPASGPYGVAPADTSPADTLRMAEFVSTMERHARDLRRYSIARANELLARTDQRVLGVHEAREGEDLRSVAMLYYGAQTNWRTLMTFNSLDSSALFVGQLVVVPDLGGGG